MQLPDLIGITGYAQHGKDSLAQHLVDKYGYTRIGFADQLKELALVLDPIVDTDENGFHLRLAELVERDGWETAKALREVRRILQELGTGVRDIIGEDAWVAALFRTVIPGGKYVVADVRFPNEADEIVAYMGMMIRVNRVNMDGSPFDNGVGTSHPSEQYIPSLPIDLELTAMDLDQLYALFEGAV